MGATALDVFHVKTVAQGALEAQLHDQQTVATIEEEAIAHTELQVAHNKVMRQRRGEVFVGEAGTLETVTAHQLRSGIQRVAKKQSPEE